MPTTSLDELCTREPHALATKAMLSDLEGRAHKTGWDAAAKHPVLFTVYAQVDGSDVKYFVNGKLTLTIQKAHLTFGDIGLVLGAIAMDLHEMRVDGIPGVRGPTPPGTDLSEADPGWRFHGLVLLYEGWGVVDWEGEDIGLPKVEPGKQSEHPARMECRQAAMIDRNGRVWMFERRRNAEPTILVWTPGDENGPASPILHGLSKMMNAWCGTPVPVVPAEKD